MSKKTSIVSISMEPELHAMLKETAKKKKMSGSEFVCRWLEQYPFNADNVVPVVLDIPEAVTRNRVSLSDFLMKKSQTIISLLCS